MTKRKTIITLLVALIVLCVFVFINERPNDYYNMEYNRFLSDDDDNNPWAKTMYILDEDTDFVGVAWKTESLVLAPGTYTITINAPTSSSANFCELYCSAYLSSDNTVGKIFARQPLSTTGETVLEITIDKAISGLELRMVYISGDLSLSKVTIEGHQPYLIDSFFEVFLIAAVGLVAIYLFYKDKKRLFELNEPYTLSSFQIYIICVVFALLVSLPLMRSFIVVADDLDFHLLRIEGVYDGLKAGQFPVRISPYRGNGFGYADQTMYPNLFLYIPAIFRLCGVSPMVSYMAFSFIIELATAFISFYCFRRLLKSDLRGLMACALYTFSLYRLIGMYSRAMLGELLAMIFLPLIILGIHDIIFGEKKQFHLLTIGICGVVGSHVLSTVTVAIICAIVVCFNLKSIFSEKRWLIMTKAIVLSILLNLWFLVPFLRFYQEGFTLPFNYNTWSRAVYLPMIYTTGTNIRGFVTGLFFDKNSISIGVGLILVVGVVLFLAKKWLNPTPHTEDSKLMEKLGNVCLIISAVLFVFASNLFPWKLVESVPFFKNFLASIQFPWRYLAFASVLLCIVTAIAFDWQARSERLRKYIAFGVVIVAIASVFPTMNDFITGDHQELLLANKHSLIYDNVGHTDYRYADADVRLLAGRSFGIESNIPNIAISGYNRNGTNLIFEYHTTVVNEGDFIEVPLYYYPGYHITMDGVELEAQRGTFSILRIMLPAGATNGVIRVSYRGLWYYQVGDIISAVTALFLLVLPVYRFVRRKRSAGGVFKTVKTRVVSR
jgi:hypothetical protein